MRVDEHLGAGVRTCDYSPRYRRILIQRWQRFGRPAISSGLNPKKAGQHAADRPFEEFSVKTQKTQISNTSNQGMVIKSWHGTGFCRFC